MWYPTCSGRSGLCSGAVCGPSVERAGGARSYCAQPVAVYSMQCSREQLDRETDIERPLRLLLGFFIDILAVHWAMGLGRQR